MWLRPWAIGILSPTGQRQPFIIYIIKPKAAQQGAANASAWECGKNSIHNHYHAISTCGCLSAYVLVQYLNYPVCQSKAYSKAVLEPWASLRLLRAQMVKICKNHIALNCHVKTLPPWHFPCSVFVCVPCIFRTFCVKCCWLLVKTLKLQRSTEAKPLLYRIPFSFSWSSEELRQHRGLIKNHYQFGIFLGENVYSMKERPERPFRLAKKGSSS
jgi:hypothetical protein